MLSRDWIRLLGVRIDNATWSDLDAFFRQSLAGDQPQQVVTVNGEHILAAAKDPLHREVINSAELVVPDSTNVVWLSRLKGRGLTMRTPGVDIVWQLGRIAAETNHSVYLLGSRPGIAEMAAETLRHHLPGLKVAGTSHNNPDQSTTAATIRQAKADIVFVAYGAPNQEYWINQHKKETGAKILVGVGGTFDMISGNLPRAPRWLRALHLEWLWRLAVQPSRWRRIWDAVVVFPLKTLFS